MLVVSLYPHCVCTMFSTLVPPEQRTHPAVDRLLMGLGGRRFGVTQLSCPVTLGLDFW